MKKTATLIKRLDFSLLPKDWSVVSVSIDWHGQPLALFQEGKPKYPGVEAGTEAVPGWLNTPPTRHHLLHWNQDSQTQTSFENPDQLLTTTHIQSFGAGWLIGEARGGLARIFDKSGKNLGSLELGDASEHLQTTPSGHIWVGYFDEGVYG